MLRCLFFPVFVLNMLFQLLFIFWFILMNGLNFFLIFIYNKRYYFIYTQIDFVWNVYVLFKLFVTWKYEYLHSKFDL